MPERCAACGRAEVSARCLVCDGMRLCAACAREHLCMPGCAGAGCGKGGCVVALRTEERVRPTR